jgi:hypothetical protein
MTDNWIEIKEYIIRRTERVFNNPIQPRYSFSFSEGIDTLISFIEFKTNEFNIDGITLKLKDPLLSFAKGASYVKKLNDLKLIATSMESYLRKILFFTDNAKYSLLLSQNKGFHKYIDELINPLNLKFYSHTPESLANTTNFAEYICSAYPLRNSESHENPIWDDTEIERLVRDVLIVYVFATFQHFDKINSILYPISEFNDYLKSVENQFKFWQSRFVYVDAIEESNIVVENIDLDFIETEWDINSVLFDESEEDFEEPEKRKGKIEDLLNNVKRFVIIGSPGTGKSTSLQFLSYKLAKEQQVIPIYIELKYFTENLNLFEIVLEKA